MRSNKIGRIVRDERGSGQVEFALSAMVILTLLFGIMDLCRVMYTCHW